MSRCHIIAGHPSNSLFASAVKLQYDYATEETALSIYMTEIRGYNTGVEWFLSTIFTDHRPDDLHQLTGSKMLKRKFVPLEFG